MSKHKPNHPNQEKRNILKAMAESKKFAGIAFSLAMVSIGYNLLPIQPPAPLLWISGLAIMAFGILILLTVISSSNKS
jgi:hypothetical protein